MLCNCRNRGFCFISVVQAAYLILGKLLSLHSAQPRSRMDEKLIRPPADPKAMIQKASSSLYKYDKNLSSIEGPFAQQPMRKIIMHRRRRRRDATESFSDQNINAISNELSLEVLDTPDGSKITEPLESYTGETQHDAGWQLRPNVSDKESMIIGASVSALLIAIMLLFFCVFYYRCQSRRLIEEKSRRSLWAATLWKKGRKNEASFVPLDDRHNCNPAQLQSSFWSPILRLGRSNTASRKDAHLSPYPYLLNSRASVASQDTKLSMRAALSTCQPQMMAQSTSSESILSLDRNTKKRFTYQHYHPSPTLAPPETAHASPLLKSKELHPFHRGSHLTGLLGARSSAIRYKDLMPSKSSMSVTDPEHATSSTVCGLGLDLDTCHQDIDEPEEREVFSGFRQWHTPSPRHSENIDERMSDTSSIISFELAEVSGVIKPCFTIERIEEFTGPIYADQIASALVEARMVSSSSVSSSISMSTTESNGDLSALFKETMAMLQKKPTLLRRSQVVGTKIKTRSRSKTCPDTATECLIQNDRGVSSEGRERPLAVPSQKSGQPLQWHLCLSPEKFRKKKMGKTKQLSSLMANVHLPGASIDSLQSDDSQQADLIPACPTHLLFQKDLARMTKEATHQGKEKKRRDSNGSTINNSTSISSWDIQSFHFPCITSSPISKQHMNDHHLRRFRSTEKVDWRSSDYHSPTLQVFHLYQDDDQNCFSAIDEAQLGDSSEDTI